MLAFCDCRGMSELGRFPLRLRYSGGDVDQRGLDLYDGSTSLHGFAQALQMVVHAYMRDDVISRATTLKGAEIRFGPPRRGSLIIDVVTFVEKYPASLGITAPIFYDFVKMAFSAAVGKLSAKPETKAVQKVAVDETFFDQLSEAIEGSLQRAHRPIDNGVPKISLERPRAELVVFDRETSAWVHTRDENPTVERFTGNITRYNSISGNARAYVRELHKVLPVRPSAAFPDGKRPLLTWSLHGNTTKTNDKELVFFASRIDSARGEAKRLILSNCEMAK